MKWLRPACVFLLVSILLAACSSGTKPAPGTPAPFSGIKVGKPYKIEGRWYRPSYDPNYVERGYASWYGPGFHGRKTASGERFDQYAMTAAHKTLPMPSLVNVKNLENGKEIVVRINDRGPFIDGRIIDLSKKAAEKLGMRGKGIAQVEVRYLPELTANYIIERGGKPLEHKYASRSKYKYTVTGSGGSATAGDDDKGGNIASVFSFRKMFENDGAEENKTAGRMSDIIANNSRALSQSAPVLSVRSRDLGRLEAPASASVIPPQQAATRLPVLPGLRKTKNLPFPAGGGSVIQAASFSNVENANRLADRLASSWQTRVSPVLVKGKKWYRVHVVAATGRYNIRQVLDKLAALGLPDAVIVSN